MALVGSLIVLLGANTAPLTAGLLKAEGQLKGFGATATTGQKALLSLGGVGLVAAAGIGLSVKAAADFQDAFSGVRKTVDEADLAAAGLTFDDLAKQFRTMATQIPVAATELASIGETAGALGIKAGDIENFTRTVALLGSTTNLSIDEAATGLGKVGTILGLTGAGFTDFADILVNLGNKGASTESEILEITKRFAAAGQAAGLTIPQILAFSSAIASAGVEPEAAGSSLSRLFGNMVKETANATSKGKAFATVTGKSFSDFAGIVKTDTVGAMLLFLGSLNKLDKFGQAKALQSVGITAVRDQNAILLLAQTYEKNLIPALANAQNSTGALSIEAQKRFDTFNVKMQLLGNNITELGISLGTALLPPLTSFVTSLTGAINGTSQWAAANQGLSSAILPVIAGIGALAVAGLLLPPAFAAIGAGILLALNPVTIIIAGLLASISSIQGFADKNNATKAAHPDWTDAQIAAQHFDTGGAAYQTAATKHGYSYANNFGAMPWGTFGTPGFTAGEPGSPFAGPSTLGRKFGWGSFNSPGFGAGEPGSPFAGPRTPTPTQVTHTTNVYIGNEKIGDIVERTLYNSASAASSGWASDERPRH